MDEKRTVAVFDALKRLIEYAEEDYQWDAAVATDAIEVAFDEQDAEVERLEIALDKEIKRRIQAEATLKGEIEGRLD